MILFRVASSRGGGNRGRTSASATTTTMMMSSSSSGMTTMTGPSVVASRSWRCGERRMASVLSSSSSHVLSSTPSSSSLEKADARPRYLDPRRRSYSSSTTTASSIAHLVKQLRESTGAPMMECRKALSSPDVNNDVTKATEWLRKHGSAKALSKVEGRISSEGCVGISLDEGRGTASIVKAASETDFASRGDVLSSFVQEVADAAVVFAVDDEDKDDDSTTTTTKTIDDVQSFLRSTNTASVGGGGGGERGSMTLEERLGEAVLALRENVYVDTITIIRKSSERSILGGYVHGRSSTTSSCGTAASIVELVPIITEEDGSGGGGGGGSDVVVVDEVKAREVARRLAMHVVAARPTYLDVSGVPHDVVVREKEIHAERARGGEGGKKDKKSPDIIDKIVSGQMRKFYEGACLAEQQHVVEEGGPKVSKYLRELGFEVKSFVLVRMGK